jgi:hypothetical protein
VGVQPSIADEETLISWARRGGPDGSNMSFNYGSMPSSARLGIGEQPAPISVEQCGRRSGGRPMASPRLHIRRHHHPRLCRRRLANTEVLGPGIINTVGGTSINLATQLEADGVTPTATLRGSLTLARVRIHDGVLTPEQITSNFTFEKGDFLTPLVSPPTHRYSFENPASADAAGAILTDSIGGADGVVRGAGATFNGSRLGLGGGFSTNAGYADLPNGLLSANSTDNGGSGEVTFEGWVRVTGNRDSSRIFDFGSTDVGGGVGGELIGPGGGGQGLDYLYLSAQVGASTANRRVEVRNMDGAAGDPPNGATLPRPDSIRTRTLPSPGGRAPAKSAFTRTASP